MRKIAITLLVGIFLGAVITASLFTLALQNTDEHLAAEAFDYVLDEWTAARTPVDTDTVSLAQVKRTNEFNFRVGYIPDTVRTLAERVEQLYRVPKGVTIAQWILESRYGLSDLGANNMFGHTWAAVKPFLEDTTKWVVRREKTMSGVTIVQGEPVRFALYKNIAESFNVHGLYLSRSRRYAAAFQAASSENFVRELSKAGYATDPDYALKLITIMKRHRL